MDVKRNMVRSGGNVPRGRMLASLALLFSVFVVHQRASQADSTIMSWTLETSGNWAIAGASVRPATGYTIANTRSSSASGGDTSTLSWNHEVLSGDNRLLVVGVSVGSTTTVSSVKYDTASLSTLTTQNGTGVRVELWAMVAPSAGTHSVTVTMSSSTAVIAGAISFTGVDQTSTFPNTAATWGADTNPSVSVTRGATDLVLDTVVAAAGTGNLTVGAGQTERWKVQMWGGHRGGGSTGAESTAVRVSSLAATGVNDQVVVEWQTDAEINTAGFNVLRAEAAGGPWVRLNSDLIPSRGSSWEGASYDFWDETREAGTVYWYSVEEVSARGLRTRYGGQLVWDEGLTDADGDGMPDAWEQPLGIDTGSAADADADADQDGSTNLEEYLAGTSPVDAGESPRLSIERDEGRDLVVLIWPGRPGRTYRLEAADSMVELLGHSPSVPSVMSSGSNGPMRFEDPVEAEGKMRFYRLIISPPQ